MTDAAARQSIFAFMWERVPDHIAIPEYAAMHCRFGKAAVACAVETPHSYELCSDGEGALQSAVIVLSCEALIEGMEGINA